MNVRWLSCVILLGFSSIAAAGTNVVVVLDDSGSMSDRMRRDRGVRKMDAAKEALIEVLRTLPEDARVGVVSLNHAGRNGGWILPLDTLSGVDVAAAISRVRATGGTPLGRFMKVGADALLRLRQQEPFGSYRLLIVTDGEASDKQLVEGYLPDILSRGMTVDVIGVDMRKNHSLATRVHRYRRADDPATLRQEISAVFAETSGTDSATSDDFALLAGLTPEWAAAAIASLTRVSNEPIGAADGAADGTSRSPGSGSKLSVARGFLTIVLGIVFGLMVLAGVAFVGVLLTIRRSS